jgi:predicted ABC-type sugar transport system permease subunit
VRGSTDTVPVFAAGSGFMMLTGGIDAADGNSIILGVTVTTATPGAGVAATAGEFFCSSHIAA